jgi:hypothetical protein
MARDEFFVERRKIFFDNMKIGSAYATGENAKKNVTLLQCGSGYIPHF